MSSNLPYATYRREFIRLGKRIGTLRQHHEMRHLRIQSGAEAHLELLKVGMTAIQDAARELRRQRKMRTVHFNLFDVIERSEYEHTHSDIIAWLLTPEGSHGLGDAFLKAFVKQIFGDDLSQTEGTGVKREYKIPGGCCDIVARNGKQWVLVIESKLYALEGTNQTKKYAEYWVRQPGGVYLAYITPRGTEPLSRDFVPVSYSTIRRLLRHFVGDTGSAQFIQQFADHI
jgi:PD-(D/E)XK nuclease superfamily protein